MVSVVLWADCVCFIFHISPFTSLLLHVFFMPLLSLSSVLFVFFPVHLNFLTFFPSFIIRPRNMLKVKVNIVHIWSRMAIDCCHLWHGVWVFLFIVINILSELSAVLHIEAADFSDSFDSICLLKYHHIAEDQFHYLLLWELRSDMPVHCCNVNSI